MPRPDTTWRAFKHRKATKCVSLLPPAPPRARRPTTLKSLPLQESKKKQENKLHTNITALRTSQTSYDTETREDYTGSPKSLWCQSINTAIARALRIRRPAAELPPPLSASMKNQKHHDSAASFLTPTGCGKFSLPRDPSPPLPSRPSSHGTPHTLACLHKRVAKSLAKRVTTSVFSMNPGPASSGPCKYPT